jgi:RimJ/RimL family protein N-acetyltransferase
MPAAAAEVLADHLAGASLPSVSGPAGVVDAFAQRYVRRRGLNRTLGMNVGVFRLDRVLPPTAPGGRLREARLADLDLVAALMHDFQAEAVAYQSGIDLTPVVERRLRQGGLTWLWEDSGPVSLVTMVPPAAGVARIASVYTPPEHRGRGYASAAVAAVSRLTLDRGVRTIMLNTDLANPTSNRIYQRIGFQRVGDAREWLFGPAA